jgi:hypothetical protein
VNDLAITLEAGPHGNQGNVIVVKARRRTGAWVCWASGWQQLWATAETLTPSERTSWKSGSQEVELELDANVQGYRRRMVGDLKIHQTCSDNDDDLLNEAK